MTEPTFDDRKFKELLLYVAKRSEEDPKFGAIKLNKILFAIDFSAFADLGHAVTGARYMKLENGPAPRALVPIRDALLASGRAKLERRDYFGLDQIRLVAVDEPDTSVFSEEELTLIDRVIEILRPFGATELSDMSHAWGLGWRLAEMNGDIRYEWVFLSSRQPEEHEIEHGRELAAQHGWLG